MNPWWEDAADAEARWHADPRDEWEPERPTLAEVADDGPTRRPASPDWLAALGAPDASPNGLDAEAPF